MKVVMCFRCQRVLGSLGNRTGFELLDGVVCENCGLIECQECKTKSGKVDAPCARCGGEVAPAYVHLIHKYQKIHMGKGCWIGLTVSILLFVGFCWLVSFLGNEDRGDWRAAEDLNEVGSYQKYLEKHPQGKYAGEAFKKIEYLKNSEAKKYSESTKIKKETKASDTMQKVERTPDPFTERIDLLIRQGKYGQLREFKGKDVKPLIGVLIGVFQEKSTDVQRILLHVIVEYQRVSEPHVMEALEKSDEETLKGLALKLGLLKDKRATGILIALLSNPSEIVRLMAVGSLETITGKRFGQDYDRWKRWWRKE